MIFQIQQELKQQEEQQGMPELTLLKEQVQRIVENLKTNWLPKENLEQKEYINIQNQLQQLLQKVNHLESKKNERNGQEYGTELTEIQKFLENFLQNLQLEQNGLQQWKKQIKVSEKNGKQLQQGQEQLRQQNIQKQWQQLQQGQQQPQQYQQSVKQQLQQGQQQYQQLQQQPQQLQQQPQQYQQTVQHQLQQQPQQYQQNVQQQLQQGQQQQPQQHQQNVQQQLQQGQQQQLQNQPQQYQQNVQQQLQQLQQGQQQPQQLQQGQQQPQQLQQEPQQYQQTVQQQLHHLFNYLNQFPFETLEMNQSFSSETSADKQLFQQLRQNVLLLEDFLFSQQQQQQLSLTPFFSSEPQFPNKLQNQYFQQVRSLLVQIEKNLLERQSSSVLDDQQVKDFTKQLFSVRQLKTFLQKIEQAEYQTQTQLDYVYEMKRQLRDLLVNVNSQQQKQQFEQLQNQLQKHQQIQRQLRQQQLLQQKLQKEVEQHQQNQFQGQQLQDANNNFQSFFYTLEDLDKEVLDEKFTLVQKQEQCELRKQLEYLEKAKQELETRLAQNDRKVSQYLRQIHQFPEQSTLLTIVTRKEQEPGQQQRAQSSYKSCSLKQETNEYLLNDHFSN